MESLPPSPDPSRPSMRDVMGMVFEQAWGLCIAYLGVGLVAETARRAGVRPAASVQEFLDGLPYFAIRLSGFLEEYLRASAIGRLTPFWNRVLLSSITVGAILLQAALLGGLLWGAWRVVRRKS